MKVHDISVKHCNKTKYVYIFTKHYYCLFSQVLIQLNLGHNKIGHDGARYIGEALQQNKVRLYLSNITIVYFHRYLHNLILNITRLEMKVHDISVKHCNKTKYVYIFTKHYYCLFSQILTQLDLKDNKIGHDGARYIGEALQHNEVRLYIHQILLLFIFIDTYTT